MKPVLAGVALAILSIVLPATVVAQSYPTKPVRIVAPFPPGGTSDTIARILGQKLTEAWKQQTIIDNRAGVAGSLGSAVAAKSPADGYTLLVGNVGPVAINHNVYKNVGYDPLKDFAPITLAVTAPQIVVVHPSVPAKTFTEFTALVKKHKGKINYGSSGPGSISHLSAELYKQMTNSDMLHVPFKGSALITTALLSGEVDVVFSDMAVVLPHVQAGKLRALAVTGPEPTPLVPGVPTVAASGVQGFAMTSWWGVLAPAGIPQPIVTRLNTELGRILKTEDVKKRFATLGVDAATSTPEEFSSLIRSEIAKYAKLLKAVGIQPQ
ncbi:MAG: tripartite tricarboxylate transporter substrate binding protein [Betaproteobacteria bacterium]|nr:tripartite tricarboxylate transporter substrate binding protein [Betaproteobacteria bacterium]